VLELSFHVMRAERNDGLLLVWLSERNVRIDDVQSLNFGQHFGQHYLAAIWTKRSTLIITMRKAD
jgi:hypothetical protein